MNRIDNNFSKKKTARARVFFNKNYESFLYNGKEVKDLSETLQTKLFGPIIWLKKDHETLYKKTINILNKTKIFTKGGGISSQINAARYAYSRLLKDKIPDLKTVFKKTKLFRVDLRTPERTKPGIKGARVRPPFNKR